MKQNEPQPQVVIVGAGFGGLRAAKALANQAVKVTLVDRNNYHLFQPLLYQVATAGLAPDEIAHPLRGILHHQKNLTFVMDEVESIDFKNKQVILHQGAISYDYLIVAAGSETNFFNNPEVEKNSFGLKDLQEAGVIRNHILCQFEQAQRETDEAQKRSLLTFVVVGGGPTGVELSGAIAELVRLMRKDFPELNHEKSQVILLEASTRLLANLHPSLSIAAVKALGRKGVQVLLQARVESYDGKTIQLSSHDPIPTRTLIWAAGVQAARLTRHLDLEKASQSRTKILPTLQIPGHEQEFIIGDAAYLPDQNGQPLPMVAQVAMQQGVHAARNILRLISDQEAEPFHYTDLGTMATIGRNQAVAEIFCMRFHGLIAWLIWLFIHLIQLVGFRNRLVVLINWTWQYFLYDRAIRMLEVTDCEKADKQVDPLTL